MKFRSLILTVMMSLPNLVFANDLYVSTSGNDSNPGSASAPFRTIQKGSDAASPGTTVHVAPGIYQEVISSSNNGSSTARIRFISDVKWGAKVLAVSGASEMWSVSGGYTDIIGFEIDATGSTTVRIGIGLSGGNSSVQNSLVHHVGMLVVCDNMGGAGLHASQSRGPAYQNYDFIGNVVHDVGGTCGYISDIYHQSSGNVKNNLLWGGSYGIHGYHDDHDINIVNNTIFGHSGYGILYGGCQEAYNNGCPTSGIKIYNNIIYDNGGGISGPVLAADVGNEVKNNLVYGNISQFDLASPSSSSMTGMIIADPQFVNYKRDGTGDYHLKSTSPAIDQGILALAPSVDLDGKPRPQGAGVDMGVYEYGGSSPTPTPTPTPTPPPTPTPAQTQRAVISLSAKTMTFASGLIGSTSAIQLVTLTNTGNAALNFSQSFSMTGDFNFGGTGTCTSNFDYVPGASCTISAVFIPTAVGTRTGILSIPSNASSTPLTVALLGIGVSANKPVLSLSTKSLTFAPQKIGSRSTVKLVTIKNTGNAPLSFPAGFSITGDFAFGGIGTCHVNVNYAPGASCTASIVFIPKTSGVRSGTLSIPSNASSLAAVVKISGTGQ